MPDLVVVASGTADVLALPSGVLMGYSIRESGTVPAAAVVVLKHGPDAAGAPIAAISLAADGIETRELPAIRCPNGIFLDRESGETTVSLYTA